MDMVDKIDLMIQVLDDLSVDYRPHHAGWQGVRCPNEFAHARGDINPSARLNLTLGLMKCLGCDLNGDAYNVVMTVDGTDFVTAWRKLGSETATTEESWLI